MVLSAWSSEEEVHLFWTQPETSVEEYVVYRQSPNGTAVVVGTATQTHFVDTPSDNTTYLYQVVGLSGGQVVAQSNHAVAVQNGDIGRCPGPVQLVPGPGGVPVPDFLVLNSTHIPDIADGITIFLGTAPGKTITFVLCLISVDLVKMIDQPLLPIEIRS